MKRFLKDSLAGIALGLLVCLLAAPPSCATFQPIWAGGKFCVTQAASDSARNILPEVSGVLGCSVSDPSSIPSCVLDGLATLGLQYGQNLLQCALAQIADAMSTTPEGNVKQRRAKAYLAQHGKPAQ